MGILLKLWLSVFFFFHPPLENNYGEVMYMAMRFSMSLAYQLLKTKRINGPSMAHTLKL